MARGAPVRKCPDCGTSNHVRKKVCGCGYTYGTTPKETGTKLDTQKPVDSKPAPPVQSRPVDDAVSQDYYRRTRTLETEVRELRKQLAGAHKVVREMLKVCKAFHDVPSSLALFKQEGEWLGMDDKREIRPVDVAEPEISFARNKSRSVMVAPWDSVESA